MIIIAHNIRSLHNVGAIFRNAAAFNVEKLYLTGITAQPPRKEIAKVALGAETLVEWAGGEIDSIVDQLREDGYKVYGLDQGEGSIPISEFAPSSSPMSGGGTPRIRGHVCLNEVAQELRKDQTHSEKLLWERLRRKQVNGLKFRRQHGIDPFIVDFYCDKARLVIEIDGEIHDNKENKDRDLMRQEMLEEMGYQVIRFKNQEVEDDINGVISSLEACFPSSYGGGKGDKLALVLGNEVEGIDKETISKLDGLIEIPMGKKRSLNVSVASGVAMYVLSSRQKRDII